MFCIAPPRAVSIATAYCGSTPMICATVPKIPPILPCFEAFRTIFTLPAKPSILFSRSPSIFILCCLPLISYSTRSKSPFACSKLSLREVYSLCSPPSLLAAASESDLFFSSSSSSADFCEIYSSSFFAKSLPLFFSSSSLAVSSFITVFDASTLKRHSLCFIYSEFISLPALSTLSPRREFSLSACSKLFSVSAISASSAVFCS